MIRNKMNYQLNYPNKIIFGNDSSCQLPELIPPGSKVMLVTGKSAVKSGLAEKFMGLLREGRWTSGGGYPTKEGEETEKSSNHKILKSPNHKMPRRVIDATGTTLPEPPLENVNQLIELGRREAVTAVVAIGGGSTIDAAKAATAIIPFSGTTEEYFNGERELTAKGLFFAALPTTAGTGAEITKNSVLTDKEGKVKKSIRSPFMVPDLAIIDPILTITMPPALTAASGLDALTQAIESYTSSSANSITKTLAKSAVGKIMNSLLHAFQNGGEITHRVNMAEGSLLSAMAFSQSGLGAVHGLAHPIGSLLGLAHGLTCSIILTPIMRWNEPVCGKSYNELAEACRLKDAKALIAEIVKLCKLMNIPDNLKEVGLKEKHFPFILKNCRSNSMRCNPREISDKEVIKILKSM
jgi:1,3-propanediol dehydrogenase